MITLIWDLNSMTASVVLAESPVSVAEVLKYRAINLVILIASDSLSHRMQVIPIAR